MINTMADYLVSLFEKTNYGTLADAMSDLFYHTVHIEEEFVSVNICNNYATGWLKTNKSIPGRNAAYRRIIGTLASSQRKTFMGICEDVYYTVYTKTNIESKLDKLSPGHGCSVTGTPAHLEIVVPPGFFRKRKLQRDEVGINNFPYMTQMFAQLRTEAQNEMNKRMGTSFPGGRNKMTEGNESFSPGGMMTHGYIPAGGTARGSRSITSTVGKYGLAAVLYGLEGSNNEGAGAQDLFKMELAQGTVGKAGIKAEDYTTILEKFDNPLDVKYDVKYQRDEAWNRYHRRSYQIQLQYADHKHNAKMGEYDKKGINNYIRNLESQLLQPRRIQQIAREMGKTLLEVEGSPSIKDTLEAFTPHAIIDNLFPHKTKADMRFKVNKRLAADAKRAGAKSTQGKNTYGKLTKKPKSKGKKVLSRAKKSKHIVSGGRDTSNVNTKAGTNPMALKNLLNEMLPQAVAQNMVAPALQYRTGRFANSVRVDNITQGPRGGNTMIEASYMNNPYETFAPGGKMHTPQRNPEKLIKKSVRQVASGLVGAKFGINIQ